MDTIIITDDVLLHVLLHWVWVDPEPAGVNAVLAAHRQNAQLSLVSKRWYRLICSHIAPRIGRCQDLCAYLTRHQHDEALLYRLDAGAQLAATRLIWLQLRDECVSLIDHTAVLPGLTCLQVLYIWEGCPVSNDTIQCMTWLNGLELCPRGAIDDNGLMALTQLTSLRLVGNDMVTGAALKALTRLTYLDISHTTHLDFNAVLALPSLSHLIAHGDTSLRTEHLTTLTCLQYLDLCNNTRIDLYILLHMLRLQEVRLKFDCASDGPSSMLIDELERQGVEVIDDEIEPGERRFARLMSETPQSSYSCPVQ